jgi:hypothetical protein
LKREPGVASASLKGFSMQRPAASPPWRIVGAFLVFLAAGCGSSPTAPMLTQHTETFTGRLQPLGVDYQTFTVNYPQAPTELSITVTSLTTVANATPVTGITIGVGLGIVSGTTCSIQLQTAVAPIGQELPVPGGVSAGTYCVQISDCPAGSAGCSSTLTEAVTYSVTVKHY